jgi:xylan 1,4-beta-xylosidase
MITMPPKLADVLRIDPNAPARPFPHFWEQMFGSGHANLSLRDQWREDARTVKKVTDFRYVRFHDIFHDNNGVYDEDARGNGIFNWTYIDQIYDGLLDIGIRPFVEMSFMPSKLASSQKPHAFWYKPLPNPPSSYEKWGALIEAFARHLLGRYGAEEVRQWYFEVWNEPNLDFWTGVPAQDTYFELFDAAARAIKRADSWLRVGGPATAQAAWVGDLIRHCDGAGLPLDFVSTHVYGNDSSENVLNIHEAIPVSDMVSRAARKVFDEVKASPRPGLPIIFSEYNASYDTQVAVTDSPFMGAWLANNIRLCDGLTSMMSYWTFSDVFEEEGIAKTPFYGGYGLIAVGGIPKAAFNAFALLHLLGDQRLSPELDDALVTKRADGTLAIALWNYAEPGAIGEPRDFEVQIPVERAADLTVLDADHGSALSYWRQIGVPTFPSREQQQALRVAGALPTPQPLPIVGGMLRLTLPPHSLALIEVKP